jgi:hypothetical protein
MKSPTSGLYIHQLAFEAVVDQSAQNTRRLRGHFVLDNVDLGTWKESENEKALNENPDTLMVDPCLGHCNFDGGFCGWSNDQEDDFDWNLVRTFLMLSKFQLKMGFVLYREEEV